MPQLTFIVTDEDNARIERLAEAQLRSKSNMLAVLVRSALDREEADDKPTT